MFSGTVDSGAGRWEATADHGSAADDGPTISRWKQRFENRDRGSGPRHKGSQPRVADAAVQARIARKTQQKPADGSTHWSCRKMAGGARTEQIHRAARVGAARLKPHRLDRYMASNDPRFEEKAADIIGLYMNPPQHAAVFCVDEKTAIQALDRLDPVLPLSPGRADGMALNTIATARFRCSAPRCEDRSSARHDCGAAHQSRVHHVS